MSKPNKTKRHPHYHDVPCALCGEMVSTMGAKQNAHNRIHEAEGLVNYHQGYWGHNGDHGFKNHGYWEMTQEAERIVFARQEAARQAMIARERAAADAAREAFTERILALTARLDALDEN